MSEAVWSSDATGDDRVSVYDRGFLLGDGIFDTLVALNGIPFAGDRHLRRLVEQAAAIGVAVDEHRIRQGWTSVLTQTGDDAAIIRTTVTRGRTERGLWPLAAGEPTIVAVAAGWSNQLLGRPVRLFTSTIRRNEHCRSHARRSRTSLLSTMTVSLHRRSRMAYCRA